MPYIAQELRPAEGDLWPEYTGPGGLNYRLTMLVRASRFAFEEERLVSAILGEVEKYMARRTHSTLGASRGYELYNEVLGVLDAAKREHTRRKWWHGDELIANPTLGPRRGVSLFERAAHRFYVGVVAPYEELKIAENGDITDRG